MVVVAQDVAQAAPDPGAPALLPPKALRILLNEANERFKEEQERHSQFYTRAGVFLGVIGVYLAAFTRFVDKPPVHDPAWLYWSFVSASCLLVTASVVCAWLILSALSGGMTGQRLLPGVWAKYVTGSLLPVYVREGFDAQQIDDGVESLLHEKMFERLAEAVEHNTRINDYRSSRLFWSAYALLAGLITLLSAAAFYSFLPAAASH